MKSYKELKVWQTSVDLAEQVYRWTYGFPDFERYGLARQVQRAAVSIASNIAEGHARDSTRQFLHHLSIALGSAAEADTQMIIAHRLDFGSPEILAALFPKLEEIGRMLHGLQKRLKENLAGPSSP